jgi:hypothetical protein
LAEPRDTLPFVGRHGGFGSVHASAQSAPICATFIANYRTITSPSRIARNGRPVPRYLRTPDAAKVVGLSIRTLEKHRIYGTGPVTRSSAAASSNPSDTGRIESGCRLHQWRSDGLTDNTVAGVDFQYRDSYVFDGKVLQADAYYMRSFSRTPPSSLFSQHGHSEEDDSAASALNFPNEPWSGDLLFKQIGRNFTPALGFVNRTAIRQYVGTVDHLSRYRNRYLTRWNSPPISNSSPT